MKNSLFQWTFWAVLAITALFISGCEDDFAEPPVQDFPSIQSNTTIAELKALHDIAKEDATLIEDDLIIEGTVTANDRSGNFFKALVIQDETAAIEVRIDVNDVYLDYPVGTKAYVICKNLYVGDFSNKHQISATEQGDEIPEPIMGVHVVPGGPADLIIEPQVIDLANYQSGDFDQATLELTNMLVRLENVEFACQNAGNQLADAINKESVNAVINDCNNNTIEMRTSGFADFAFMPAPTGNGSITAIFGVFTTTRQITIRDMNDLNMEGPRCAADGCDAQDIINIRNDFILGATSVSAAFIEGTVISDGSNNNIVDQNLVIQDATGGIVLRFNDAHNFALGDKLFVAVAGLELSEFNGLLQINNIPNENATVTGTGEVTPRVATIQEITNNFEDWESTLIKIEGATLSGGTTFNGSITVEDATGSILMFTRSAANFSGDALPSGEVNVTGIVSQFNDPQINIRNRDDVEGGTGGGGDDPITIQELKDVFTGGGSTAPNGKIKGTVISDRVGNNVNEQNITIQDGTAGIVVRFSAQHSFNQGDEVEISVSGLELSEFNNTLQVNGVSLGNATVTGTGSITPNVTTFQNILDNFEALESTLVQISDVTISGSSTFAGTLNLMDPSGSMLMFTFNDASFADEPVPGTPVTLTGIVSQFGTDLQVNMRNINDIQ